MSKSRIRPAAAVLVLAGVLVVGLPAAGAPAAATAPPDVTTLFDQAVSAVRANSDFSKAVMLEADGKPKGRKAVKKAAAITRWRFVFDNQGSHGSNFASVTINYRRSSGFGEPRGHTSPFLEDQEIRQAPKMTLRRAVRLLKQAGYRDGFFNVTLRAPLGSKSTPPLYIFTIGNSNYVAVNTKTEEVAPLS